jgi:hypothetical protein
MQNSKFVGVCLLLSSLALSAAIVYHARATPAVPVNAAGRYQFHPSTPFGEIWILDTTTGQITDRLTGKSELPKAG